jgi:hypothetical protein
MVHTKDTIALNELTDKKIPKATASKRESGISDGHDSHGSEEMWVSGAENAAHKKNVPGSVL